MFYVVMSRFKEPKIDAINGKLPKIGCTFNRQ